MVIVLSPAKKMRSDVKSANLKPSQPMFQEKALPLVNKLSRFSKPKLMKLMSISENLAKLNLDRYDTFSETGKNEASEIAIHAFNGDVFLGLESDTLTAPQLAYANKHLRILSGLYGYLRPSDEIQPYRLEMGSSLKIGRKKNLYEYWQTDIASAIQEDLNQTKSDVIINLASKEYFKAVDTDALNAQVITIHFREYRDGKLKAIQFNLKRARGLLARFIIVNKIKEIEHIKGFDTDNYVFEAEMSSDHDWYFVR